MRSVRDRLHFAVTLPHSLIVALGAFLLIASTPTIGVAKEISHETAKRICKGHAPAGTGCAYCKGLFCTYVACTDKSCDIVVVNAPTKKEAEPSKNPKVPAADSVEIAPAN
jgi:hypothetical protein